MALEDADLVSIQEARSLAARARAAQLELGDFTQEQVDAVVAAMAAAALPECERLARLAHEETGFGNVGDKTLKNRFCARDVFEYVRPMRTVGILREDPERKLVEIAAPMGVVAAVIPSTRARVPLGPTTRRGASRSVSQPFTSRSSRPTVL